MASERKTSAERARGRPADRPGAARSDLRGEADLGADDRDPGRGDHERVVRVVVFSLLAAKNGRQIDPSTTVGRVIPEMVPPGAEALQTLRPGSTSSPSTAARSPRGTRSRRGYFNAPETEVRIELAGGEVVAVPIHPDALEGRIKASQAIQPFRRAVVGRSAAGEAGATRRSSEGRYAPRGNGRQIEQWYDLLDVLNTDPPKGPVVRCGTRSHAPHARHATRPSTPGPTTRKAARGGADRCSGRAPTTGTRP